MSFKHINFKMETTMPSYGEQLNGLRSARHSVAATGEGSRLAQGRGPPLWARSSGVPGSSAGSVREKRNGGTAGPDVLQKTGATGSKAQGGGASSQAFMKAYYEEKQKNQQYQSPVGDGSRRSTRNRPGVNGATVGQAKSSRMVEQPAGNAQRTQRGAPQKAGLAATAAKKSATNHGVPPPSSSGVKAAPTCYGSSSSYYQS